VNKTFLILALGSSLALSAQNPDMGVQAALSLPTNDLSDNANFGLQMGGHLQWDFHGGHGLMARADLTFYTSNHGTSVNNLAAAADYTYHFETQHHGPYVLAGLSLANYHTSFPNSSHNDSGLGIDLGGGYELDRHLGLQARYTSNSTSPGTYSALNLGVTYKF
jgi:hypothetical protein